MDGGDIYNNLLEFWDEVSKNWTAEAKQKYYHNIFCEMLDNVQGVMANNISLQQEAQLCLSNCSLLEDAYYDNY